MQYALGFKRSNARPRLLLQVIAHRLSTVKDADVIAALIDNCNSAIGVLRGSEPSHSLPGNMGGLKVQVFLFPHGLPRPRLPLRHWRG